MLADSSFFLKFSCFPNFIDARRIINPCFKGMFSHVSFLQSLSRFRPKRHFISNSKTDNSSQMTFRTNFRKASIRPKRQFVPISEKRQFVPSDSSSHFEKATIRLNCKKRQFVPIVKSDNSSQIVQLICLLTTF